MDLGELQSFFRKERLATEGRARHDAYVNAQPFPHAVFDDFFPESVVAEIADAVDRMSFRTWIQRDGAHSLKQGCPDETVMDPGLQAFLHHLNSGPFLHFLEAMTGIDGLVGDPHYFGGGLHRIRRGGFLKIHADFNHHQKLRLDRRLNLLLYLNRNWKESYGGHLELWDRGMQSCVQRILPVFNRCVVFSTTDDSFHGHPDPLACPEDRSRQSIALYYYTNGRPAEESSAPHSTLYKDRPAGMEKGRRSTFWKGVEQLTPPIVFAVARALRRSASRSGS